MEAGCDRCAELELEVARELELRGDVTEMFKQRMLDMSVASQARAKAVKDANKNRLSRAQSDKLREQGRSMRKQIEEAAAKSAAQQASNEAMQRELEIAKAAAVRYDEVRRRWEAANEDDIASLWEGELFEQLETYVEGGRDAVRARQKQKELSERTLRLNRNKKRAATRYKKKAEEQKERVKEAVSECKRVARAEHKDAKRVGRAMIKQQTQITILRYKCDRTRKRDYSRRVREQKTSGGRGGRGGGRGQVQAVQGECVHVCVCARVRAHVCV